MTPADASPPATETPSVGVIYNPRSHRNRGQDLNLGVRANIFVAQPADIASLREALARFAARGIDYLVINGGDGTVRDVLTAGVPVFGRAWPDLAVLPKGKTNALNVDLGAPPGWTIGEAIAAWPRARRIARRPLLVEPLDREGAPMLGFIFGAGAYTLGIRAGQDAHRLGAFDSLAVGVTAAWGMLQALLGTDRNAWRRGVDMAIALGPERQPMPRTAVGDPARRHFMLASTLERFPAGLKVFGELVEGLKLLVVDHPRRRLLLSMPAALTGRGPARLEQWGLHRLGADPVEIAVADEIILDGEAFPAGRYRLSSGPELRFLVP
ncbi:acylglycerol kinase family protein [Pelagerythrobacter marinus]|uniref:acylglycerol kinase family protein n=1 Tax=Pelagerythrobacter marinus TaxID=538382 RepID=UPI002037631B|nr:acylglycerol kinase family protein [Pelagerythrobacter marinus]USA39241.1 acylglycerol kinase family protein [Pelagerythrobacter marinus]WPZ06672.1 acylglycerol kinase family protein [Pelagerythrobacter marinus]